MADPPNDPDEGQNPPNDNENLQNDPDDDENPQNAQPLKKRNKRVQLDLFGDRSFRPPHTPGKRTKKINRSRNATVQLTSTRQAVQENSQTASIQIDLGTGDNNLQVDLNGDVVHTSNSLEDRRISSNVQFDRAGQKVAPTKPTVPIAVTPSPARKQHLKSTEGSHTLGGNTANTQKPLEHGQKNPAHDGKKAAASRDQSIVDLTLENTQPSGCSTAASRTSPVAHCNPDVIDLYSITPPVVAVKLEESEEEQPTVMKAVSIKIEPRGGKQYYKSVPVRGFRKRNGTYVHPHQRNLKSHRFNYPLKEAQKGSEEDSISLAYYLEYQELEGLLDSKRHGGPPNAEKDSEALACKLRMQEIQEYLKNKPNRYV